MGLWSRIFGRTEQRAEEWGTLDPRLAEALGGGRSWSGEVVTAQSAESLATVMACVGAIAGGIASLPAYVYRATPDGREEVDDHPLARMIRDGVNDRESWPDFLELWTANALLRGNGLAEMVVDDRGAVRELRSAPWDRVTARLLPSGRLAFDIRDPTGIFGPAGKPRRLLQGDVLHLKDRSDDGILGRSRLSRAREAVGAGIAVQHFAGAMYRNGATPRGAIVYKNKLNQDQVDRIKAMWRELFSGPNNAAKTLVLDQDGDFKPFSVSPEDAELLASRRFTTEELARVFNVPPPIVGIWDHSSFTNSETAGRWFASFTLTPWIRKIEAEFSRALLSRGHSLEIDLSGLTRGDYSARWAAHKIAVNADILTRNEVRQVEGYNKRTDGDRPAPKDAP